MFLGENNNNNNKLKIKKKTLMQDNALGING
jgi:hypothetical protein